MRLSFTAAVFALCTLATPAFADHADTTARVEQVIADYSGNDVADVTPGKLIRRDLDIDEAHTIELVLKLQDEFEIEIPSAVSDGFGTVADVIAGVEKIQAQTQQ